MVDHRNVTDIRNGRRSRGASPNEFSEDSSGDDSDHGMCHQRSTPFVITCTLKMHSTSNN